MTMGEVSEVKAQTLDDLSITFTGNTYLQGTGTGTAADNANYWTVTGATSGFGWSTDYVGWFYSITPTLTPKTQPTLPAGTYVLVSEVSYNSSSNGNGTVTLSVTKGGESIGGYSGFSATVSGINKKITSFYVASEGEVDFSYSISKSGSSTVQFGFQKLYKVDQSGDKTALFSEISQDDFDALLAASPARRLNALTANDVIAFDGTKENGSTGWTIGEGSPAAGTRWNWGSGSSPSYVAWFYNNSQVVLSKTLENLPVGSYLLSSFVHSYQRGTLSVSITRVGEATPLATFTYTGNGSGSATDGSLAYTKFIPFYNESIGNVTLTYTITATGTINWGDEYLYSISTKAGEDGNFIDDMNAVGQDRLAQFVTDLAAKKTLQAAIGAASDYRDGIAEADKGDGWFQYPTSAFTTLTDVITAAQSVVNANDNDNYAAKTTAVNDALDAFKAAKKVFEEGKNYYVKKGSDYLNICKYPINWPNCPYIALFTTLPYVVQFEIKDADANQYYIKNVDGQYLGAYKNYSVSSTYDYAPAILDGKNDGDYFIATRDGINKIKFQLNSLTDRYISSNSSKISGTDYYAVQLNKNNNGTVLSLTIEEATEENVSMFISSSADWGTFVAPFAVELTGDLAGVEAYTITTDGATITKSEALSTIPANTPVLLHKTGGLDATNVSGYAQSYYTGLPEEGNLVGFLATGGSVPASVENGDTYYVLQKQGTVVGWYKVTSELTGTVNRAYLKVPAGGDAARQFIPLFDDSETTGIMQVNGENVKANDYYNLKGQRVSQPTKGLYIVGGRKVMVK